MAHLILSALLSFISTSPTPQIDSDEICEADEKKVYVCCRRHPLTSACECWPFNGSCAHCLPVGG